MSIESALKKALEKSIPGSKVVKVSKISPMDSEELDEPDESEEESDSSDEYLDEAWEALQKDDKEAFKAAMLEFKAC